MLLEFNKNILTNSVERTNSNKKELKIKIISTSVVYPLDEYIEYICDEVNLNCEVDYGEFNNIISDLSSLDHNDYNGVIILPNLDIEIPDILSLDASIIEKKVNILINNYKIVLENLPKHIIVSFWGYFSEYETVSDNVRQLVIDLNTELQSIIANLPSINFIDSKKMLEVVGREQSIDHRYRLTSKAPFSQRALHYIAKQSLVDTSFFNKVYKKVLVLDCDNTLWGGILVEDGFENIACDPYTYPGNVFFEIQQTIAYLESKGVIIALISKNDEQIVDKAFLERNDMPLKKSMITTQRINWLPKSENLKNIAQELNLSLDSFIFIDDSDFEISQVNDQCPEVVTLQVPKNLSQYARIKSILTDTFTAIIKSSGASKTAEYKFKKDIDDLKRTSFDELEFIRNLKIHINVTLNKDINVKRSGDMILKTNQFNLTTKRDTLDEVSSFIVSEDYDVMNFSVSDIFTNHGIVGLAILKKIDKTEVVIESLILSCRVFGRYIENKMIQFIKDYYYKTGYKKLTGVYIETSKNFKFKDFYVNNGFEFEYCASDCNFHHHFLGECDDKANAFHRFLECITTEYQEDRNGR
ncbi:MAG: HAD-IIIC family phosphatase [Bacteroidetes bacterium]|nr:HAD-IIIC family phosphatase [Bacteroidota bacterium]MDA0851609.1 HAD-IIIC family phosphatase [Pseudomonadota bacterium]